MSLVQPQAETAPAVRPLPRRASCPVRPSLRARARAANAVSEGASWGHLSAGPPRGPARRLHLSRVLVLSDPRLATPGRCWPGRGGSRSTGGLRCPRGQEGGGCADARSMASCVQGLLGQDGRSLQAGRPGPSGLLGPLGGVWVLCTALGVWGHWKGSLGGALCGVGAAARRLLCGTLHSASVSCAAPGPSRGADSCASERPGAGWAPGEPRSWCTLAQVTECRL